MYISLFVADIGKTRNTRKIKSSRNRIDGCPGTKE